MRFWDSSAVVPLLVDEPTSRALQALLEDDAEIAVWWGTPVECTSALARREREGYLSAAETAGALERLRVLAAGWQEVVPGTSLRSVAQRLLRVHPLRGSDALQLAAAITASEHEPSSLAVVCLDQRLTDAARREGFAVLPGATG